MNLVLFTHPSFQGSRSHPHFARMLLDAYRARGHQATLRQPEAMLRRHVTGRFAKWAGYVDQYLLYPSQLRRELQQDPPNTLYVFCDQALGPWIPHVAHRPHVVHCHDLLALRSALGDIAQNPTSASGRVYQRYIRSGFRRARHFISVSRKSRDDLHRYGGVVPVTSEVVYNGLNHAYRPLPAETARDMLARAGLHCEQRRWLLHVGGGQWYKNTPGVVRLYARYARRTLDAGARPLPLWMVSPPPDAAVRAALAEVPPAAELRFVQGLDGDALHALYAQAEALLFPSLAEGFGWPILEALACGCPVLTTGAAPMSEVGGDAATYVPLPRGQDMAGWAEAAAETLVTLLSRTPAERERAAAAGIAQAARFRADLAIDGYLAVYERVLAHERSRAVRL